MKKGKILKQVEYENLVIYQNFKNFLVTITEYGVIKATSEQNKELSDTDLMMLGIKYKILKGE